LPTTATSFITGRRFAPALPNSAIAIAVFSAPSLYFASWFEISRKASSGFSPISCFVEIPIAAKAAPVFAPPSLASTSAFESFCSPVASVSRSVPESFAVAASAERPSTVAPVRQRRGGRDRALDLPLDGVERQADDEAGAERLQRGREDAEDLVDIARLFLGDRDDLPHIALEAREVRADDNVEGAEVHKLVRLRFFDFEPAE
jgi:hypothetical protein